MHTLLTSPLPAAVHENVLLARVAVEVTVELDLATLQCLPHHLLDGKRLREQLGARVDILPIQVVSGQAASIVTYDNAVWIQHGHYFEHVALAQH